MPKAGSASGPTGAETAALVGALTRTHDALERQRHHLASLVAPTDATLALLEEHAASVDRTLVEIAAALGTLGPDSPGVDVVAALLRPAPPPPMAPRT